MQKNNNHEEWHIPSDKAKILRQFVRLIESNGKSLLRPDHAAVINWTIRKEHHIMILYVLRSIKHGQLNLWGIDPSEIDVLYDAFCSASIQENIVFAKIMCMPRHVLILQGILYALWSGGITFEDDSLLVKKKEFEQDIVKGFSKRISVGPRARGKYYL